MKRLDGKVAFITGAARGQGAAEARLFVEHGATVYLTDVLDDEGQAVADSIGATYLHLDVTSSAGWHRAAELVGDRHGRLDVLVNNAGIPITKLARIDEIPFEDHRRIFDVNVNGAFHGMQAMLPLLLEAGTASVVNVSSINGLVGVFAQASYTASKHAVLGLGRAAAIDLGPLGIRVNTICPGIIDTPIVQGRGGPAVDRLQRTVERQPIPRMGTAEEVAYLALYLASDESSYCTGQSFTVDGGHLAGPYREAIAR